MTATPKGPLKRYQELWRTDEAKAFLAVFRTHWVPDMADVPVYREEPVVCSDLLLVSNGREAHYELYGIDLGGVGKSWVSDSREGRVRIPQDDGTWRWEKESVLLEPPPDPVPEPGPVPEVHQGANGEASDIELSAQKMLDLVTRKHSVHRDTLLDRWVRREDEWILPGRPVPDPVPEQLTPREHRLRWGPSPGRDW
jgi:hypothetical protein